MVLYFREGSEFGEDIVERFDEESFLFWQIQILLFIDFVWERRKLFGMFFVERSYKLFLFVGELAN